MSARCSVIPRSWARREVGLAARREIVDDADLVAAIEQRVDEVGPDEAGSAGDEGAHGARILGPAARRQAARPPHRPRRRPPPAAPRPPRARPARGSAPGRPRPPPRRASARGPAAASAADVADGATTPAGSTSSATAPAAVAADGQRRRPSPRRPPGRTSRPRATARARARPAPAARPASGVADAPGEAHVGPAAARARAPARRAPARRRRRRAAGRRAAQAAIASSTPFSGGQARDDERVAPGVGARALGRGAHDVADDVDARGVQRRAQRAQARQREAAGHDDRVGRRPTGAAARAPARRRRRRPRHRSPRQFRRTPGSVSRALAARAVLAAAVEARPDRAHEPVVVQVQDDAGARLARGRRAPASRSVGRRLWACTTRAPVRRTAAATSCGLQPAAAAAPAAARARPRTALSRSSSSRVLAAGARARATARSSTTRSSPPRRRGSGCAGRGSRARRKASLGRPGAALRRDHRPHARRAGYLDVALATIGPQAAAAGAGVSSSTTARTRARGPSPPATARATSPTTRRAASTPPATPASTRRTPSCWCSSTTTSPCAPAGSPRCWRAPRRLRRRRRRPHRPDPRPLRGPPLRDLRPRGAADHLPRPRARRHGRRPRLGGEHGGPPQRDRPRRAASTSAASCTATSRSGRRAGARAGGRIRYVAAAALDHRRAGDDARLRALARAAYGRGQASRRFDVFRGTRARRCAAELRVLAGCALHGPRFRCANGPVMTAHSAGRLRALVAGGAAGAARAGAADDFLSGHSGTVGGRRGRAARARSTRCSTSREALSGRAPAPGAARRPAGRGGACSSWASTAPSVPGLHGARPRGARAQPPRRHDRPRPGGRAAASSRTSTRCWPATTCGAFDWLLVVDDDVALPRGFLDRFLHAAERAGLRLAQPAHRLHSHAAWAVTRRRAGRRPRARRTSSRSAPSPPSTATRSPRCCRSPRCAWAGGSTCTGPPLAARARLADRRRRRHARGPHPAPAPATPTRARRRPTRPARFLAGRPYVRRDEVRTLAVHR